MSINLQDIAAISGLSGLYRIIRPTRNGVIVESLDEQRTRSVAQARQRLSLLQEISIYTTDAEETVPLTEVINTIQQKYGDKLPVSAKSSGAELADFMGEVVPNYDTDRVYTSDMKKLVQWYSILNQFGPTTAEQPAEAAAEAETEEAAKEEKPKATRKKKAATKED